MLNANLKQNNDNDNLTQLRAAALHLEAEFKGYQKRALRTRETIADLGETQQKMSPDMVEALIESEKRNMLHGLAQLADIYEDSLVVLYRYMGSIGLLTWLILYVEV